jgi:hypothetical protein
MYFTASWMGVVFGVGVFLRLGCGLGGSTRSCCRFEPTLYSLIRTLNEVKSSYIER